MEKVEERQREAKPRERPSTRGQQQDSQSVGEECRKEIESQRTLPALQEVFCFFFFWGGRHIFDLQCCAKELYYLVPKNLLKYKGKI